ncbi:MULTISPECIES: hypothetical protein [unclassified Achromobacter]|uniref:hypothetical protein n=1 Tax=unclassified Achromobacter TaxID=2626865 RepID=UPI000B51C0AE|nr:MULTISPECIES: hypothetical protein [unclassified Achromobacter]OWT72930.1 hypothetical protein CEY05_23915 [Achromobacter sp. HZ34]OWT74148.1 hypothetical protein CEY04_22750 [Achromobacter sp. HZ28]
MHRWSKARLRYQIILYHGVAVVAVVMAGWLCARATRLDPPPGVSLSAHLRTDDASFMSRLGAIQPAFDPVSIY